MSLYSFKLNNNNNSFSGLWPPVELLYEYPYALYVSPASISFHPILFWNSFLNFPIRACVFTNSGFYR